MPIHTDGRHLASAKVPGVTKSQTGAQRAAAIIDELWLMASASGNKVKRGLRAGPR